VILSDPEPEINKKPCGSEPARDEAITFNILVASYTAIASRLAPTVDRIPNKKVVADRDYPEPRSH
jgi:hypothetical protein